jgi:glycyl-tRNA synthetase
LANAWDYGPYGSMLKKNISDIWIKTFVTNRDDMVLMDTAIIANPQTWVASGHVGNFKDPLIDDKNSGQRFRADKILEDWISKKNITVEYLAQY